jgi:hypothetical protein
MGKRADAKLDAVATAKLEAVARASYQRKKVITEAIPPDVTRAKAGAWLDLISPITEWAGLRGDKLRQKRNALRLQQEEVLNKIVYEAIKRLGDGEQEVTPLPNKFLVPFLEKASLEDVDSKLIETWTTLLTAAATAFNPRMVRFCSILAELGPDEVRYLHRLCRASRVKRRAIILIRDVPLEFYQVELVNRINELIDPQKSHRSNAKNIIDSLELPGGIFTVLCVHEWGGEGHEVLHPMFAHDAYRSIALLQSLGIVNLLHFLSGRKEQTAWYAEAVALTEFGVEFVCACDPEIKEAENEQVRRLREMDEKLSKAKK